MPIFFISFSTSSLPFTIFSSLCVFLNQLNILLFAPELLINFNQSMIGPLDCSDVIISTISPFFSSVIIGIILLFILHPVMWCPISACILYAKSIGVLPFGKDFISPFGVNTYTSSSNNSVFNVFKNSSGSCISFCHSNASLIHASLSSVTVTFVFLFLLLLASLYAQCAAIPNSAILCISHVRIWTSNGVPFCPINVVCNDWYIFGFGTAM